MKSNGCQVGWSHNVYTMVDALLPHLTLQFILVRFVFKYKLTIFILIEKQNRQLVWHFSAQFIQLDFTLTFLELS